MTQNGYNGMAEQYADTFPTAYQSAVEEQAVAAFVELAGELDGVTVDVGCGLGHVTADLVARGLDAVGCDPSVGMLHHARRSHPDLHLIEGDATLAALPENCRIAAIIARFSLIHIEPPKVAEVLGLWSTRLDEGAPVLIAFQACDEPGPPIPFDHAVAPAWRWHPDEFTRLLEENGFAEERRIVYRDSSYRFPMANLFARRL
jgi:SAM-dependent methyltransferase